MPRIKLLPDALINKIAAGEVVERPASVVKELCENSVDAGATCVKLSLRKGGLELVAVSDDGVGMSREDAQLAMQRHATSKLDSFEGLTHIMSKGFRGEALPAIASVSRFRLTTAEPSASVGTQLAVEGGGPLELRDAPPAPGTLIEVEDLFFNTPARRKFMKRDATELVHCQEAIYRLALAHPEVSFIVEHEGRELLNSPASRDVSERIAVTLGSEVHPHLLAVDEQRLGISVKGYVASPEFTLPNARGIYALVNHRYVRDRHLIFAIQRAFADSLPPGRQPVAVLFIDLDPATVDVNVHPQKLEVRFSDARGVQEAVSAAVSKALKSAPWHQKHHDGQPATADGPWYQQAVHRYLERAQTAPSLYQPTAGLNADLQGLSFGQARPGLNEAPPEGYFSQLQWLGPLGKRFWVCEGLGGTLLVVDPHAVRERLALHRLWAQLSAPDTAQAQPGLFSATVELDADEAEALERCAPTLKRMGVVVERFGPKTVALKGLPEGIEPSEPAVLLRDLLAALPKEPASDQALAPALQALAAHARGSDRAVGHSEARALLAQLDEVDFGVQARGGKVVVHEVALLDLVARAGG